VKVKTTSRHHPTGHSTTTTSHTTTRNLDRRVIPTPELTTAWMGTLQRVVDRLRDDEPAPPDYTCLACNDGFDVQHHVCPNCGGYSVERNDW